MTAASACWTKEDTKRVLKLYARVAGVVAAVYVLAQFIRYSRSAIVVGIVVAFWAGLMVPAWLENTLRSILEFPPFYVRIQIMGLALVDAGLATEEDLKSLDIKGGSDSDSGTNTYGCGGTTCDVWTGVTP